MRTYTTEEIARNYACTNFSKKKWIRIDQLKELTHDDIIELIHDE